MACWCFLRGAAGCAWVAVVRGTAVVRGAVVVRGGAFCERSCCFCIGAILCRVVAFV